MWKALHFLRPSSDRLYKIDEVEEYKRSNPYILTGYRGNLHWLDCLKSVFSLHNETLNIWTHLLGFIFFAGVLIRDFFSPDNALSSSGELLILVGIILSYQATMILSALFHIFTCHSKRVSESCLSLDLLGITLCILVTYLSGIYYAFYCDPFWRDFYFITVGGIFLFAGAAQLWPKFAKDEYSHVRIGLFTIWAIYGLIPTVHWVVMRQSLDPILPALLPRIVIMYGICGLAFFFYLTKLPERILPPGIADFIGHSHQWWHAFIFLALTFWHNTGASLGYFRSKHGCSVPAQKDVEQLHIWPLNYYFK